MKWYEKLLVLMIVCGLLILIGCAAMQDAVTPCTIEPKIVEYIKVSDPNISATSWLPWSSLRDSQRMQMYFNFFHIENQTAWQRLMIDDDRFYDFFTNRQSVHDLAAIAFKKEVFTPEGAIGALMFAGLGTILGKYGFSSPADRREIEKLKNGGVEKPQNVNA